MHAFFAQFYKMHVKNKYKLFELDSCCRSWIDGK